MSPVLFTPAMRFLTVVLALILSVFLQACGEKSKDPQASYDLMKAITFTSTTEGKGRYRQGKIDEYTITGTGVVVGNKYLTVDHVVSQYGKVIHFGMSSSTFAYTDRIGYPAKIGHYYREARFAGMMEKGKQYNGHQLPVEAIAIFPSLITGDSGSGLFDKDTGRLMGINYYNVQTLGLAKPIAVFQPYLGSSKDIAMSGAERR